MRPGEHFICSLTDTSCPVCHSDAVAEDHSALLATCPKCHAPLKLAVVVDQERADGQFATSPKVHESRKTVLDSSRGEA